MCLLIVQLFQLYVEFDTKKKNLENLIPLHKTQCELMFRVQELEYTIDAIMPDLSTRKEKDNARRK